MPMVKQILFRGRDKEISKFQGVVIARPWSREERPDLYTSDRGPEYEAFTKRWNEHAKALEK